MTLVVNMPPNSADVVSTRQRFARDFYALRHLPRLELSIDAACACDIDFDVARHRGLEAGLRDSYGVGADGQLRYGVSSIWAGLSGALQASGGISRGHRRACNVRPGCVSYVSENSSTKRLSSECDSRNNDEG